MSVFSMETINDILVNWRESNDRGMYRDAQRTYQWHACEDLIFGNRKAGDVSYRHCWVMKTGASRNTVESSMFDQDSTNRVDLTAKASTVYSFWKTHYLIDIREPSFQSGKEHEIVNYLAIQEADMWDGLYEKLEQRLWLATPGPNDGSTGDILLQGIPSIITQDNTSGNTAFDWRGVALDGYSNKKFELDVSSNRGLKNGTAQYTNVTDGDLGRKLTMACKRSYFRPGRPNPNETMPARKGCKLYSSYEPWFDYQESLFGANENVGRDLAKYRSKSGMDEPQLFHNMDWHAVPALGEVYMTDGSPNPARDLREPIYGINLDDMEFRTYGSWWERDAEITPGDSHNTRAIWMDFGGNLAPRSLRSHFVITKTSDSDE